ncbi:MAG: 6-phosphogluconolactonase [Zetaproteobacteria bacterium CG06_land_8_20_14_3_00_59_53]|nr:MAG: 6-phosphogluconolactonase [Zetaproteobacteria bacterium CG2_30_59_37]PIO89965.1 MAG: 6-phosphogluconolactonase [Zetaproteobacteria bacterium CG23_combo_of_CG06-09_8_20_14_all_59_86]PIQ64073.1 MAG: 6-phosphogluconolactonase [Zetaproteobacteria bacterium CG11_big_fil_rev_8_21_14_0_20_59_439]PIU69897.1 MAG: 6-phosphogluconolactonase [Zetaproteobacteria bacterium CG06_land_8_20_14_3_00_59_53]PIU97570.1 MAG: 6-phosphogluconolactonase [Zetaproteobacteria bacterium CG03_land_8_20_14_0_80_59_51
MQVEIFADAMALARVAAEWTVKACNQAIAERGVCHLVLAGGTSPRQCYEVMRGMQLDWSRMHIWFGDERCVPADHPDRNDCMADEALLSHVAIPHVQIHRMHAELGPEEGARLYAAELACVGRMDVVHLGMGEDGHTCSLFPGKPSLNDGRLAFGVSDSPKPPPERVTVGYAVLNAACHVLVLSAGKGKQEAIARIRAGEQLPVARVKNAIWYIDRDAAGDAFPA